MTRLRTIGLLCGMLTAAVGAQEPAWNSNVKDCDRACLVGVIDAYMSALYKKNPKAVPPLNLVTMETFSVRGGQIHHVEAFRFVTLPYGLGNGWTPGSGR